jgi:hypothetical protein
VTLPFVDEHSVEIPAAPDAVWDALWAVLERTFGGTRGSRLFGRAVGVRDTKPLVGFRIAEEERGRRLVLEGEHRFARYRLTFRFEDGRLGAATHAAFPGPHGRVYRALILLTGFHARVVSRLLRAIGRAAARDTPRAG